MNNIDRFYICVCILLQGNVTFTNRTREVLRIRVTQYLKNGKEHNVTSYNIILIFMCGSDYVHIMCVLITL